MITLTLLKQVMPISRRCQEFLAPLLFVESAYELNTVNRLASFLAQIAHESGELRYTLELASGDAYDTGRKAEDLGNTPEADGDGRLYKGRGLIQVTGKANYTACSLHMFGDASVLLRAPQLLERPLFAAWSAGWFWSQKRLNGLADAGDFSGITRRVNGGFNGIEERRKYYARALDMLKLQEARR